MECYRTAVGDHPVDEIHVVGVKRNGAVTFVKRCLVLFGKRGYFFIKYVVFVNSNNTQTPSCRAKIFRERIDQYRVVRGDRGDRIKTVYKCTVNIIGKKDKIVPFLFDELPYFL